MRNVGEFFGTHDKVRRFASYFGDVNIFKDTADLLGKAILELEDIHAGRVIPSEHLTDADRLQALDDKMDALIKKIKGNMIYRMFGKEAQIVEEIEKYDHNIKTAIHEIKTATLAPAVDQHMDQWCALLRLTKLLMSDRK